MARRLRYTGNELPLGDQRRGGWLAGVPAADHTCPSDAWAGQLVASGLYEYVDPPAVATVMAESEEELSDGSSG